MNDWAVEELAEAVAEALARIEVDIVEDGRRVMLDANQMAREVIAIVGPLYAAQQARAVAEAWRDALLEAARRLDYEGIGWKKSDAAIWSLAATDLRRLAARPAGEGSET